MMLSVLCAVFTTIIQRPVLFSTGLYGVMPSMMYNNILDSLRLKNASVINAPNVLTRRGFEEMCDEYEVDKLPLITHSSFDGGILKSHRLEKALLLDPAVLPAFGASGLVPTTITPRAPTNVICSKLYGSFVKPAFQPKIEGANYINLKYGGHSDMLDGMWPWVASTIGIESDSDGASKYKDFLRVYMQEWLFSPSYELSVRKDEE